MATLQLHESETPQRESREVSDAELAYAAGLIDGEGCITIDKCGGKSRFTKYKSRNAGLILRVRVYNANKRLIAFLAERFGGAVSAARYKAKPHYLDQY